MFSAAQLSATSPSTSLGGEVVTTLTLVYLDGDIASVWNEPNAESEKYLRARFGLRSLMIVLAIAVVILMLSTKTALKQS